MIARRLLVYREETESCIRTYPGTILTRIHANQPIFDVHFDIIHALAEDAGHPLRVIGVLLFDWTDGRQAGSRR